MACDFNIQNCVVAGFGVEDLRNLFRVYFHGYGIEPGAVQHGRYLACYAHAARGIFIEFALTGLGYDYFWHFVFSRFFLRSGTECCSAPFVVAGRWPAVLS
jgi:hypothetical protein